MRLIDRDALLAELRLGREADQAHPEIEGAAQAAAMAVWSEVLNRIERWEAADVDAHLAESLRPYEQELTARSGVSIRAIVIFADAERAAVLLRARR